MMYKFGKLAKKVDVRTLQLKNYLIFKNLPPLLDNYDVDSEFINFSDNNMYNNSVYGDCVIAGRAHITLRFEDFEQGLLIPISDDDVTTEYFKETGGFDTGLVMLDSLNEWRQSGWLAAGKLYNIHSYAEINIKNHNEVMYCIYLLRGAYTGFSVPQSAMNQFKNGQIWDVVSNDGGIVGGHCVYIVAYNSVGPICMTWGKRQPMTWAFWDKYFDEAYGIIDNTDEWVDPANDPLDIPKMDQELSEITSNPPNPQSSPCPFGRGLAKIANFFLWLGHRRGRFQYVNRKEVKSEIVSRIKSAISDFLPLIFIGCGLMISMFTIWQLDIMFCAKMWGSCRDNITFYQALIDAGWKTWASSDWFTINAELFPNGMFTSGFWYDALMITNIVPSWFLTAIGAYMLPRKLAKIKARFKYVYKKITANFKYDNY